MGSGDFVINIPGIRFILYLPYKTDRQALLAFRRWKGQGGAGVFVGARSDEKIVRAEFPRSHIERGVKSMIRIGLLPKRGLADRKTWEKVLVLLEYGGPWFTLKDLMSRQR
jgi:hypothetical protein